MPEVMDRRQDVGSKMFIGIMSAVLTTIFLGTLGLGIRAYELGNKHEVRLSLIESFVLEQRRLNDKWDKILTTRALERTR